MDGTPQCGQSVSAIRVAATAATAAAVATTAAAAAVAAATATVAAVAAATATVAAVAATAAATFLAGPGLVDDDAPPVEFLVVEAVDRGLSFLIGRHLDEAEAAGTAGVAVGQDTCGLHGSILGECLLQRVISHRVGEVANKQSVPHGETPSSRNYAEKELPTLGRAPSIPAELLWGKRLTDVLRHSRVLTPGSGM